MSAKVVKCWGKTGLLDAWDTEVQREAIAKKGVLFKHGTLDAELEDVQEVDTAQDADGGEGIMDALEKEMTDDEAWGMV